METDTKVMSVSDSKKANFETEKPVEKQEISEPKPVETPVEVKPAAIPKVEPVTFTQASPVMDEKMMNQVVDRISERLIPALKPAPMTVREFGPPQSDPSEDTVDRLAKILFKSKNG